MDEAKKPRWGPGRGGVLLGYAAMLYPPFWRWLDANHLGAPDIVPHDAFHLVYIALLFASIGFAGMWTVIWRWEPSPLRGMARVVPAVVWGGHALFMKTKGSFADVL